MKSNKKRDFILASINHVLWSTHPVANRYLQVYAHPITFDGQAVLSTSKLISAILLCSCGSFFCPDDKNETKKREVLQPKKEEGEEEEEEEEGENKQDEENQLIHSINKRGSQRRAKILMALLFGAAAVCRESTNTASANFTLSYNIVTINSLQPIFVSIGDAIFFKNKLPSVLWPCVIISSIGCMIIALSQSPLLLEVDDDYHSSNSYVFTGRDAIGCGLQFFSILVGVGGYLIMKQSENTLSRDEMVQTNNICNFIMPLLYTLVTNPKGWRSFLCMNVQSVVALMACAVLVYTFGSIGQMSLVRSMGPGLYSSISAIRVLGVVFLSSFCLDEPVKNWFEWVGLFITMITMTYYTIVSMGTTDGKRQECDGNKKALETKALLNSSPDNKKAEVVTRSHIKEDPNVSLQNYDTLTPDVKY